MKNTGNVKIEEIYRATCVGRTGVPPHLLRLSLSMHLHMQSPDWQLSEPHSLGDFYGGFISRSYQSLSPLLLPLPSLESGVENFKLLIMAWPFWWPSKNPPRITSLERKHCYHQGNFKGFRELCVGNLGQRPNIITEDASNAVSLRKV